jgi:Ni,Fe-hydrogenase I cytochrome b subunit
MGSLTIWHWLILLSIFSLYFLPTFIAFTNKRKNKVAISALNILLGWTLLGWVASLVWALMKD